MKKNQRQNIILGIVGAVIIGAVIAYFYSAEQTRNQGFTFGNELQSIQDDLKKLQTDFESKFNILKEGDIGTEKFLEYSNEHITKMENLILRYDELVPPDAFATSVELFKESTQSQLESDRELIEWIKTDDEGAKIRSDLLFQESVEYEMSALAKFNAAKAGINP